MGSDPQEAKLPTCALYTLSVSRLPQNATDRATVPVTILIYRAPYHYTTKEHTIVPARDHQMVECARLVNYPFR